MELSICREWEVVAAAAAEVNGSHWQNFICIKTDWTLEERNDGVKK
jgi:hypothetical protein